MRRGHLGSWHGHGHGRRDEWHSNQPPSDMRAVRGQSERDDRERRQARQSERDQERASAPWSQLARLRSVTSKLTFSPPDRMSARRCLRTIACAEVFVVVHAAPPAR